MVLVLVIWLQYLTQELIQVSFEVMGSSRVKMITRMESRVLQTI